jgi:serine/threonine protein kinase
MSFTPQNLCGFLIRSRLLTPEEMRAMFQRWQADAKDNANSVSQFTKWLVAHQYVTDYQATLLAKGHGDPEVYFLSQYKILDRLGRGRMAGVYKAMHALGQIVAIKVLPPSRAKNPQMLGRFQREARLALKFKHPNVVRSFQVGEAKGLHYLVMEYLEGETLEEVLLRRKRLPPAEAVRLVHQAFTGLQHIHELGMVHRDLKPSNLMLVPGPAKGEPDTTLRATVKVLDIGLGRALFDENAPTGEDRIELTAEGVILGTPDYLAPEQARDPRTSDIRSDIYSLGCVLYHLLTGQTPFPDTNFISQMVRHATETPRPLQQFNAAIPDGLQQIVHYMMAKQAAQRYPTPERAAQALQMFLMAESQPPRAVEEAPQMRKYLTWLENAGPSEPETMPPTADPTMKAVPNSAMPVAQNVANLPVAKPVPAPAAPSRQTPVPPTRAPGGHKKHKKHRHKHGKVPMGQPRDQPAVRQPAAGPQEFDVELVPVTEAAPVKATAPGVASSDDKKTFGLTTREWILIGIGAGVLAFAVILGMILVSIFGSRIPTGN